MRERPGPLELHPQPDLVIVRATAVPTGTCVEGEAVLTIAVEVRNRGPSTSPASFVGGASPRDGGWGGGAELPPIAPGETARVAFAVGYPFGRPELVVKMTRFDVTIAAPRVTGFVDVIDPPCRPMPSLVALDAQVREAIGVAEAATSEHDRSIATEKLGRLRAEKAELERRLARARLTDARTR